MTKSRVFGAVRATTLAALCAGAGLALAGCDEPAKADAPAKPVAAPKAAERSTPPAPAAAATPAPAPAPAADKPAGEKACGGEKGCSAKGCGK